MIYFNNLRFLDSDNAKGYYKIIKNQGNIAEDDIMGEDSEGKLFFLPDSDDSEMKDSTNVVKIARKYRDTKLLESDKYWMICTSMLWSTGSYAEWKKNDHCIKWAVYRQALRDVPQQTQFPLKAVWPVKPPFKP